MNHNFLLKKFNIPINKYSLFLLMLLILLFLFIFLFFRKTNYATLKFKQNIEGFTSTFFDIFGFSLLPLSRKRETLNDLKEQRTLIEQSGRDDRRFRNLVRVTGNSNDSRFFRPRPTRFDTIDFSL